MPYSPQVVSFLGWSDCQALSMFRSGDVFTISNADWLMRSLILHRSHISRSSCLKNPGERNDVLQFSIRVQNVKAYAR